MKQTIETYKPFTVELAHNSFIEIVDEGEFSTAAQMKLKIPVTFDKDSLPAYIKDAKRILNKESKTLNRIGITRLLAALLIEVYGNSNYGEEN